MATSTDENISPQVVAKVAKEIKGLVRKPLEGIKLIANEDNIADVRAIITGPEGTPYEGGSFKMKLILGNDYPTAPPKGFFLTTIFHPNVAKNGAICVSTLKKDWKPSMGISHILTVVKCLLIHPNPESALNEEAGKLILEDFETYSQRAKMMTDVHARSLSSSKSEIVPTSSSLNNLSGKKRAGDKKFAGKKVDKKRGLKRL